MGVEEALSGRDGSVLLKVEVRPSSRKVEMGYDRWRKAVTVKIRSPPIGGRANRELLDILKSVFESDVRIVRGEKSSSKVVEIEASKEEVLKKLRDCLR